MIISVNSRIEILKKKNNNNNIKINNMMDGTKFKIKSFVIGGT